MNNRQIKKDIEVKKVRLVGTRECIFDFIRKLNPDEKIFNSGCLAATSSRSIIIGNIRYEILPYEYQKYRYVHIKHEANLRQLERLKDDVVGRCDGIICCGLSQEEKDDYSKDHINSTAILLDYDSKTTTPVRCLQQISGIDFNLLKDCHEKGKSLFFIWNNRRNTSLDVLNKDVRDCILSKFFKVTFKDNLTSWSFFQKNINKISDYKKKFIYRKFGY